MGGCCPVSRIRYPWAGSEHTYFMSNLISSPYLLVSGCSHTAGTAIDYVDSWSSQVSLDTGLDLVNLSAPGACAQYVAQTLCNHLSSQHPTPKLVIAQWPNPYRAMSLRGDNIVFTNVHSPDNQFLDRMKKDPDSFWEEWTESIIEFNAMCDIPLINICFESQDFIKEHTKPLEAKGIQLHIDEKQPGRTWHFDSMAEDKLHHSSYCHRKWADRILTIIKHAL